MRSPWNGGSSALRSRMCSGPSSSSTRARAEQRLEDRVALARVQHVRVAGEDALDVVGVATHDPRRAAVDVQRERVAVARAQPARVRAGPRRPSPRSGGCAGRAARAGGSVSGSRLRFAASACASACGFGLGLRRAGRVVGPPPGHTSSTVARRVVDHEARGVADRVRDGWRLSRATTSRSASAAASHHHVLGQPVLGECVNGHGAVVEALGGVVEQRLRRPRRPGRSCAP